jgi:hypothetical protein
MKMRHELKHRLNFGDAAILRSRLGAVLPRDSHADENGRYSVRSLYFDTPSDKALHEKLDSVDRREKFRLRRYPNHGGNIMLEKKVKIRGLCSKFSAPLTYDECEKILSGETAWMPNDDRALVCELYTQMRSGLLSPKAVIEYVREPYVYSAGNVRITFDTEIRAGTLARDFLNDNAPLVPVGEELVVLEVKYDEYIPEFIECLLQIGSRRAAACSKYEIGRRLS